MIKRNLPNAITLLNLLGGCCTVVCILYGQFETAFIFYVFSSVTDFLDGAVARALQVKSELGVQLDSLADMVSFGLVPGLIFYSLLEPDAVQELHWAALPGFVVTLFSALRLGKFNLDTRQTDTFLGLPTPACTMFTIGLMLIAHFDSYGLGVWVTQPLFLYGCIAVLSFLLISELPMFNLKFRQLQWKGNEIRIIFAVAAAVALFGLREAAFALIIIAYIALSVAIHLFNGKQAS
ncbi:MAG: CDP-alcohol phosphatidyltransferase family protein [Saprospiraceae bacterium]|nr:CDP-alcohol phosphatidyltransferase family protein [Saprospiraceae bacterium]MDZ4705120.1 CDP-alcohol phosphatidyltransferase family protein [Saprospiraceae bacterium]